MSARARLMEAHDAALMAVAYGQEADDHYRAGESLLTDSRRYIGALVAILTRARAR